MATSEIEKLERRYAENPHGLTFAPLAEVHRKNGDTARALELLRIGLELHPNYIPASIVLGRCQQDLGDLPAAEEAFAHVLRLDDENVIALKSLADINERQDRLDDAERWLRRLVSVDRSSEEARQQLRRLETAREEGGRVAASAPEPAPVVELSHEIAASAEASIPEPAAPAAGPESAPPDLKLLDLSEDVAAKAASEVPKAEAVSPEKPAVADEPTTVPGLIPAQFEPPKEAPEPIGLEIETEQDVVLRSSGASEFSVPDASQDFAALAAKLNEARPRTPGRRATDRIPEERREPPPALKVEPALPAQPEPVAAASRSYTARETNGQSIGAFFRALLGARPPGNSAAPTRPSAPSEGSASTRPAQDALALRSALGEGDGPGTDAAVSFDDFFGSPAAGSSSRDPGSPEPGKDDLDQFHSWLQNLKR